MRRVESVIDTWYDSGAMPFAQFHYPFENEELFEERFPADFICEAIDQTRGWFYTLLAESTLLFGELQLPQLRLPRPDPRPRGPEDVEEQGQRGRALGRDRRPRRRRLPLVLPDRAAALVGLPLLGRHGRRIGAPVPAHPLEHVLLLGPLRQRRETSRPADFPIRPTSLSRRIGRRTTKLEPRGRDDLDRWALSRLQATIATVRERMDAFDCTAAGRAIAEFVEELSNWYVRLSRRRFWEGDRAAFATLRHCLLETAALLAPFTPFLADEIHLNLAGGEAEELGELPDSVHLRDFPEPDAALADPELEAAMEAVRLTVELGRAARAQAKAKVRQPLRRAVIVANDAEREAISARADLVTRRAQRQGARLRRARSRSWSATRSSPTTARSAPASASGCRRSPPRSRRSTPSTSPG